MRALSNALTQNQLHHAYLLTGTRGIGKTTIARILAKCLNCETGITATPCGTCKTCEEIDAGRFIDLFEIDAASRTKVEDTREILDNVQYTPSKGRFKIYLIDEVHMLSGHSFNALLKTLEEPPPHVKFILATTDHQKLPATVLSRCLQFHLTPLLPNQITEQLEKIAKTENVKYEVAALNELAKAAKGSLRDSLSLLDQAMAYGNNDIKTADVKHMLGIMKPDLLFDLLDALAKRDGETLFAGIQKLTEQGADFSQALSELLVLLHQINVLQVVPNVTTEIDERVKSFAKAFDPKDVQLFYQIGVNGLRDLTYAPNAQLGFEMTLLRMLAFYPAGTTAKPITKAAKKFVVKTDGAWHELLPSLKLKGAALALAQQCSVVKRDENGWHFTVKATQKPLLQEKQRLRIQDAINSVLEQKVRVTIKIGETESATPAQVMKQEAVAKHSKAEKQILGDKNVQKMMEQFGAEIVTESIQSTEK